VDPPPERQLQRHGRLPVLAQAARPARVRATMAVPTPTQCDRSARCCRWSADAGGYALRPALAPARRNPGSGCSHPLPCAAPAPPARLSTTAVPARATRPRHRADAGPLAPATSCERQRNEWSAPGAAALADLPRKPDPHHARLSAREQRVAP